VAEAPVTVILVAYHGDEWIPRCIASLSDASRSRLHLVLVDNSGNSVLDQLPLGPFDAEVISTPGPLGFAEANNFALMRASRLRRAVIFLNQDTISPAGWIDECCRVLDANPKLGAVSPLIRTYEDDGWDPSFLSCLSVEQREMIGHEELDGVLYVTDVPAPAMMVPTGVLRRTGPFDPIFGSYYEDYDLCRRIREEGYDVGFATGARIRHFSGSTTSTRERELARMRHIIRNRFIHQLRSSRSSRSRQVARHFTHALPRRLARGLARTPSSQPPLVTIKAHFDLLKDLPRLISRSRDEAAWRNYLAGIGWNDRFNGMGMEEEVLRESQVSPDYRRH